MAQQYVRQTGRFQAHCRASTSPSADDMAVARFAFVQLHGLLRSRTVFERAIDRSILARSAMTTTLVSVGADGALTPVEYS